MALHGQEMMLKEQLDGVVIAVPTHMHLAIAEVPWQSSFVEYVEYPHLYMFYFFPGSSLPRLIMLKSRICICYIHASLEPRKEILVQHYFPLVYKCLATGT